MKFFNQTWCDCSWLGPPWASPDNSLDHSYQVSKVWEGESECSASYSEDNFEVNLLDLEPRWPDEAPSRPWRAEEQARRSQKRPIWYIELWSTHFNIASGQSIFAINKSFKHAHYFAYLTYLGSSEPLGGRWAKPRPRAKSLTILSHSFELNYYNF